MLYEVSWFVILAAWWGFSVTAALPLTLLIKYNTTCRRKFFCWFLVNVAGRLYQPRSLPWRKKAFELLKSNMGKRNSSVPLEVMEIGVGEGANLKFYPDNCNLTILDQNKWFEGYFYDNAKKFPHINYKETVICPAENMHCVPDNTYDVVVSTYLHCSCQNSDEVLQEVKRVLKPGGKYVFLEHVKYPNGQFGLFLQRFIRPIWNLYLDGCNLDRDTAAKMKRAGFSHLICDNVLVKDFWMYLAQHEIIGVATK